MKKKIQKPKTTTHIEKQIMVIGGNAVLKAIAKQIKKDGKEKQSKKI